MQEIEEATSELRVKKEQLIKLVAAYAVTATTTTTPPGYPSRVILIKPINQC